MILHVIDTDGNPFYVTEMNAIDAATGQARVIFTEPSTGKTFIHLYADFFRVVRVLGEDGEEVEVPQYQVQGVVDAIPAVGTAEASEKGQRKKKTDKIELKPKPVRPERPTGATSQGLPAHHSNQEHEQAQGVSNATPQVYFANKTESDDLSAQTDETEITL